MMENRDAHTVSYPKKHFSISKIFEAQKCSPTKCVGTVSQKHRRGSSFPPPFFSLTFFDIKSFETQKGSSKKRFATVKQTFSKHNGDVRPFFHP